MGNLKKSHFSALCSSCKGALHITEKLTFQQILGQSRAVDGHKGILAPGTQVVDALGKQLLAGAGLTVDQNIGIRIAVFFSCSDQASHGLALVQDMRKVVLGCKTRGIDPLSQLSLLCLDLLCPLEGDHRPKILGLTGDRDTVDHHRAAGTVIDLGEYLFLFADHLIHLYIRKYLPDIRSNQGFLALSHIRIAAAVGQGDDPFSVNGQDPLKGVVHNAGNLIPLFPLIHRDGGQCQCLCDSLVHRLPAGTYHHSRDIALFRNLYRGISPHYDLVPIRLCPQHRCLQLCLIILRIAAHHQVRIYLVHLFRPIDHVKCPHHCDPFHIPPFQAHMNGGQHVIARGLKLHTGNLPPLQGMGRKSPCNDHIRFHMLQFIIIIVLDHPVLDIPGFRPFTDDPLDHRQDIGVWCEKYKFNHKAPPFPSFPPLDTPSKLKSPADFLRCTS